MNSVIIIGNLARDPELRYSTGQNQTAICRFTVAVNDGYGDNQRTSFIPVLTFGKIAENCDKYLAKGRKVAVNGRIQTGSYEKDGRKIYTTDVVASSVEFLSSSNLSNSQSNPQAENEAPAESYPQGEQVEGFSSLQDDDIPF